LKISQYSPDVTLQPVVVKQVLNMSNATGSNPDNSQSVNQFLEQYFNSDDLTHFQQDFKQPVEKVAVLEGPNDPSDPGIEAMLDIEYIMGIGNHIPSWFISTGGEHEGQEPFLEWITNLLNNGSKVPWVNSISYGDEESTISRAYADSVNTQFMKFGLTGRSLLFASGDNGVGCNSGCSKHEPNWPASSPYVTAVGGVVLERSKPVEISSDSISSGGFSNYFPMPDYQRSAVQKYLNSPGVPSESYFNKSGRAMPDVALFSEDVLVIAGGGTLPVGGTSCAAPMFSAVIALINDARLNAGKTTLGFLNPALYSIATTSPSSFYDVKTGPSNSNGCCPGFPPALGWDGVTGLGVPNFPDMLKALVAL